MIELLDQRESVSSYPATPSGLSAAAAALAPGVVWDRLFAWISWRWGTTLASYTLSGCGEFVVPLSPATVTQVSRYSDEERDWISITPQNGPRGVELPVHGVWRIICTAGGDDPVPPAVQEAYRRLAEYLAQTSQHPAGVSSMGSGELNVRFRADYAARALQLSGAADLLRPYRLLGRH